MVKSFDDLLSFLLDEVALCGEEGAQISDFLSYIDAFYESASRDEAKSNASKNGDAFRQQAFRIDRLFQEQVWTWLTQHPEVQLRRNNEPCRVTLSQAEASGSSLAHETGTVPKNPSHVLDGRAPRPTQSPRVDESKSLQRSPPPVGSSVSRTNLPGNCDGQTRRQSDFRLFASEERMWYAVAGHGPDLQRIPKMEFICLSIITSRRDKGIVQGDLTKITGQDKRSIPKRTQNLHEHGYIEKKPVLFGGARTSWLYAKRYAPASASLNISPSEAKKGLLVAPEHAKGPVVDYRAIFNGIFGILRDAKSKLITNADLIEKMKNWPVMWRSRHRLSILRRLEIIGCVREVNARAFLEGKLKNRRYRCLKMVREPTEADWRAFLDSAYRGLDDEGAEKQAQQGSRDDFKDNDVEDPDRAQSGEVEEEIFGGEIEEVERAIPRWIPEQPISNFIFDLVRHAGEKGISTMDIQSYGLGDAWKKPIEQLMNRHVDHWQSSQPLHLRHLAIIRDTALVGKAPHYIHYTYENFKSLVDKGMASWDAVATNSYAAKNKARKTIPPPEAQADLDEYGFPKLSFQVFQGAENGATLGECVQAVSSQTLGLSRGGKAPRGRARKDLGNAMEIYKSVKSGRTDARTPGQAITQGPADSGSIGPSTTAAKQQESVSSKIESQYSGKKKGRPRKVQRLGLPTNFDKLSTKKKNDLMRLQRYGIKYASERAEEDIALRVADGLDINKARELVLAEVDAQCIRSEERPISSAIVAYLGLPQPLPPYLPSIAAHTLRYYPTEQSVDEIALVTAKRQRGRKPQNGEVLATTITKSKSGPVRKKQDFQYLPSIAAHTFPYDVHGISTSCSKKRKHASLSPAVPNAEPHPKGTKYYTTKAFYEDLYKSTARLFDKGFFLSAKERNTSRRGQPYGRLAILKSDRLLQTPWFVPAPIAPIASVNRPTGAYHTSPFRNGAHSCVPPNLQPTQWDVQEQSPEVPDNQRSPNQADESRPSMVISLQTNTARDNSPADTGPVLDANFGSADTLKIAEADQSSNVTSTEQGYIRDRPIPNVNDKESLIQALNNPKKATVSQEKESETVKTPDPSSLISSPERRERATPTTVMDYVENHERHAIPGPQAVVPSSPTSEVYVPEIVPSKGAGISANGTLPPGYVAVSRADPASLPQLVVDQPKLVNLIRQKKTAGGSIAMLRKSIILELLSRCGGVIPGDKALEAPFAVEWNRRGQIGQPDKETVRKTVDALCAAGKVRKLRFSFRNAKGLTVTKSMVATTEISATDPQIHATQRAIIFFDPACYYPKSLEVPAEWDRRVASGWRRALEDDNTTVSLQHKPAYVEKYEEERKTAKEKRETKKQILEKKTADIQGRKRLRQVRRVAKLLTEAGERLRKAGQLQEEAVIEDENFTDEHLRRMQDYYATLRALLRAYNDDQLTESSGGNTLAGELHQLASRYYAALEALAPAGTLEGLGLHRSLLEPSAQVVIGELGSRGGDLASQYRLLLNGASSTPGMPRKVQRLASLKKPASTKISHPAAPPIIIPRAIKFNEGLTVLRFSEGKLQPLDPSEWDVAEKEECEWANAEVVTRLPNSPNCVPEPPPWAILDLHTVNGGSRSYYPLRNNLAMVAPLYAACFSQDEFVNDVDALLEWELHNIENSPHAFLGWPFVNHVMNQPHIALAIPMVDMNGAIRVVKNQGDKGRIVNRPLFSPRFVPENPSGMKTFRVSQQAFLDAHGPVIGSFGMLMPNDQFVPSSYREQVNECIEGNAKPFSQLASRIKRKRRSSPSASKKRSSVSGLKRRRLSRPAETVSLEPGTERIYGIGFRGPRKARIFGFDNEKRLLVSVVVVRTIAGGLEQRIDWVLVAKIFHPEYDEMFIHSLWPVLRTKNKLRIEKLTSDFQNIFPKAYEERAVPPIDFDHLDDYPWNQLMDWTMENMGLQTHSNLELPTARSDFDKLFSLKDSSEVSFAPFFDSAHDNSVAKRRIIQSKQAFVCPIIAEGPKAEEGEPTTMDIIKSFVRANIMTPEKTYNPARAFARLSSFENPLVSRAVKELMSARILVGQKENRLAPGRNYKLSKSCLDILQKKPSPETLQRAAAFKRSLDHQLRNQGSIVFDNLNGNEHAVVLLNLFAHGRITLRPHNPPMNRFGFLSKDGNVNYETRKMDRTCLHFAIRISATDTYIAGNPLLPLPDAPATHLGQHATEKRIPFWYDIHDKLIPELWDLARAAVLAQILFRPGIRKEEIARRVSPTLGMWELELVLGFLRDAGVGGLVKGGDGWSVREWWWLALDRGEEHEVDKVTIDREDGNGLTDEVDKDMVEELSEEAEEAEEGDEGDGGEGESDSDDDALIEELIMQGA